MPGPPITQIDHVSVIVTDVERSRRFYRDLLGLKEIAKPKTFDFVVLWFDLGNQQLHLLLRDRPDPRSPRHFALRVADCAAARAKIIAKYAPGIHEPQALSNALVLRSGELLARVIPVLKERNQKGVLGHVHNAEKEIANALKAR